MSVVCTKNSYLAWLACVTYRLYAAKAVSQYNTVEPLYYIQVASSLGSLNFSMLQAEKLREPGDEAIY